MCQKITDQLKKKKKKYIDGVYDKTIRTRKKTVALKFCAR